MLKAWLTGSAGPPSGSGSCASASGQTPLAVIVSVMALVLVLVLVVLVLGLVITPLALVLVLVLALVLVLVLALVLVLVLALVGERRVSVGLSGDDVCVLASDVSCSNRGGPSVANPRKAEMRRLHISDEGPTIAAV